MPRLIITLSVLVCFLFLNLGTNAQTARRGSGDLAKLLKTAESRSNTVEQASCEFPLNADEALKINTLKSCIVALENKGQWKFQKEKYLQLQTLIASRPRIEQLNVLHELSNKMRRYDDPIEALKIKQKILNDPAATTTLKVVQHQALAIDYANVFF